MKSVISGVWSKSAQNAQFVNCGKLFYTCPNKPDRNWGAGCHGLLSLLGYQYCARLMLDGSFLSRFCHRYWNWEEQVKVLLVFAIYSKFVA